MPQVQAFNYSFMVMTRITNKKTSSSGGSSSSNKAQLRSTLQGLTTKLSSLNKAQPNATSERLIKQSKAMIRQDEAEGDKPFATSRYNTPDLEWSMNQAADIQKKMQEKIQLGVDGKPVVSEAPKQEAPVPTPTAVDASTGATTQPAAPAPQGSVQDVITDPVTGNQYSRTSPTSPYQQMFQQATTSGLPAPTDYATANAMTGALRPPEEPVDITAQLTEADPYLAEMQQMYDDYFSPKNQTDSLVKEYKKMVKQSGIEELDMELINMANVIDGTEDDIRNEVTKAGGFATDSQVLALTSSRNKQLIKNYNTLLETRNAKQKYLDTMIGLVAQDKQMAAQQFDRQMNFLQQKADMGMKAREYAQNSFNKIVDQVGYKGLYDQASKGGAYGVALAEESLGLARGGLLALANQPLGLKDQLLSEQILTEKAQRAKIYSDISNTETPATLNGKPQNAVQSAANGYADRLAQSNVTINDIGKNFTGSLSYGAYLPNALQTSERQVYEQAKRNFITAILRRESGAAISPTEFATAEKQYFPQAGDQQSVLEKKAQNRNTVINNFYREANVQRPAFPGDIVESEGVMYRVGLDGVTLEEI